MSNLKLNDHTTLLDSIRNKLTNCSKNNIIFYCNSCGEAYSIPLRCDLILCEKCGYRRFLKLRKKFLPILKIQQNIKLLTLTWVKGSENKGDILLRHRQTRRLIKEYFDGGIYTFEGLAQHVHCLVVGRYVPTSVISNKWKKITKTSKIVDIRKANLNGLNYILKYVCKPPTRLMSEFVKYYNFWFHNRRVSTVGIFYNYHQVKIKIKLLCPKCGDTLTFYCISESVYDYPLCKPLF
jgi:DNA-directed RNA polymerase subunit RPC12/RpoP